MPKVYAVNVEAPLSTEQYNRLAATLPGDKLSGFRRFEDAQRTLVGHILARYLICQELNIRNDALQFAANRYGKPYLRSGKGPHFNVSHAGDWVVCCTDRLPVGIDIEQVEPIDLEIADRFFSTEESASLRMKAAAQRTEYFYALWTLKESYIKALGKGLSIPLASFTIRIGPERITVHPIHESGEYYFRLHDLHGGYKLAVCTQSNSFQCDVQVYGLGELYENFLTIS